MDNRKVARRGFLGKAAVVLGGLAAVPLLGSTALADRPYRRRGWGWGGYRGGGYWNSSFRRRWRNDTTFRRRYYRGGYGYDPYYRGGYRFDPPPVYYNRGYNGYYGPPGGGFQLRIGPRPLPGYYPPMLKRVPSAFPDPLALLEA